MPDQPPPPTAASAPAFAAMMVGAIGVVFGDIGTSPLYTVKTVLQLAGGAVDAPAALGVLSLLVWTLIVITTVKYVNFAMRLDNDGEGGILALMALIGIKRGARPAIIALGLFGAALIYGDGAITPAISVLSALEGLKSPFPAMAPYVLSAAVAILVLLFGLQPLGTARIGKAFGPVMLIWFGTLAALGLYNLALRPAVLWAAVDPLVGLAFLVAHGWAGFAMLGGVFLCVTGAEALYADMGHFGAMPIRRAWSFVVFPALVLNYAGQAALLASGHSGGDNVFYALCPAPLLLPVILLATLATIIASQAIITGAFSMTRQAIRLGWLPPLLIRQTSAEGYGQIYVGSVNWLLAAVTIALTLGFQKSDNLAAAYGIAVSLTMLLTSGLLFLAMREIWGWSVARAGLVAGLLGLVDVSFVAANSLKLADGGYVPLLLALAVYGVMWTWHRGTEAVRAALSEAQVPVAEWLAGLDRNPIPRTPGTAVFLTRLAGGIPSVLSWHVRKNKALAAAAVVLKIETANVPWIADAERLTLATLGPQLWRAEARYGFMERPDVPGLVARLAGGGPKAAGIPLTPDDVTYYVGHETLVAGASAPWSFRLIRPLFMALARNSAKVSGFLRLPGDQVVEIGREVEI